MSIEHRIGVCLDKMDFWKQLIKLTLVDKMYLYVLIVQGKMMNTAPIKQDLKFLLILHDKKN